jgi:hypothetical protein
MLRFPRLQGSYEGSRVEGTGEIARFLTPAAAWLPEGPNKFL